MGKCLIGGNSIFKYPIELKCEASSRYSVNLLVRFLLVCSLVNSWKSLFIMLRLKMPLQDVGSDLPWNKITYTMVVFDINCLFRKMYTWNSLTWK